MVWSLVNAAMHDCHRGKDNSMNRTSIFVVLVLLLAAVAHGQTFNTKTARAAGEKLSRGDRAGAMAVLDAAIAKGKDLAEAFEMRANLRISSGDLQGAANDLSSGIDLDPTNPLLYERRAMYRSFLRDTDGALKDYDFAIANGLKTERVFVGRAGVKRDSGDFEGALSDFLAALSINPNNSSANLGLAGVLERTGKTESAIIHLQEFVDRYEGKRDGKLPTLKGGEPIGETVIIKREGKEKDGGQLTLTGTPTRMEIKGGTQADIERFTNKREQLLNLSLAFFNLGRLLTDAGELDRALLVIEKGLKIFPSDTYGTKLRGNIRIKKGDLAGAIADLDIALNSPMVIVSHADKAVLATLKGDDETAARETALHLQEFPNGRGALERRIAEAKEIRTKE